MTQNKTPGDGPVKEPAGGGLGSAGGDPARSCCQGHAAPASGPNRRRFFSLISFAFGGVAAAVAGVPVIGFLLGPFFSVAAARWENLGKVDDFSIGKTVKVGFKDPSPLPWAGMVANNAAWLRRISASEFEAFAVNCSHLGCPVRWQQESHLFLCPCHGGVYYANGNVAGGPPPRPLTKYEVRIAGDFVQLKTRPLPI